MDAKQKKLLLKAKQERKVTLTEADIERIKLEATGNAINQLLAFPLLALRDEFEFGAGRLERFQLRLVKMLEAAELGHISLKDVRETLTQETGIEFE